MIWSLVNCQWSIVNGDSILDFGFWILDCFHEINLLALYHQGMIGQTILDFGFWILDCFHEIYLLALYHQGMIGQ
jgi:hypothetical protein